MKTKRDDSFVATMVLGLVQASLLHVYKVVFGEGNEWYGRFRACLLW